MDSVARLLSFYNINSEDVYSSVHSKGTHQGQRKLNVMEEFFLRRYGKSGDHVLYVGAAPGTHIVSLAKKFSHMTFVLYDPLPFDERLRSIPNVQVHQCFFTDETAKMYIDLPSEEKLFICDIRSSGYATGTASSENDEIIIADMGMQSDWTVMLGARRSMLKFKPLYPGTSGGTSFRYLDGELFMQPFAKKGSTEMRLVVHDVSHECDYDKQRISRRCAFYNQHVRSHQRDVAIESTILSI